jgi:DNA phosphorothioation-dependent restriction protein DptH
VIEQKILMTPDVPVSWRLPIRLGQAGDTVSSAAGWSDSQQAQTFLSARTCYFEALRAEGRELVTQAADLRRLRSLIIEYAEAYQVYVAHLLKRSENTSETESQRAMLELRNILALDTITLDITNHMG